MRYFYLVIFVLLSACQQIPANTTHTLDEDSANVTMQQGIVVFYNIEGGFYGIISDVGEKLYPINLAAEYKQQGAHISFSGEYVQDHMSVHQWGKAYRIAEITLLSAGTRKQDNQK